MKKKSTSQSAFFNIRVLIAAVFCLAGIALALSAMSAFSNAFAQASANRTKQDAPGTQTPEITQLVGPVRMNTDLRNLPYIPPAPRLSGAPLKPFFPQWSSETSAFPTFQSVLEQTLQLVPSMPPPLLTFDGVAQAQSGCGCEPPDTNGDVGPNHYVEAVNSSFKVFDKNGNTLAGPTTFNSLFASLVGTPCAALNRGDPFAFYDQVADRWVVSDFAFATFGGSPSWECIAVSQTPDPVAGGWFLYALLVDPIDANDYPKAAMWNNPTPGGAYHFTYNMWTSLQGPFTGVKVSALDRGSMLTGGPANAITIKIPLAGLTPDVAYSLVPAGFRTGNPPPAVRDEMLLAVRSGNSAPATFSDVLGWLFHVDFANPGNSTLGLGPDHSANAMISVNPYTEAWISTGFSVVPQQGTSAKLDSLGDKIMTPVVYQNRNGTESLWADQTTILNYPNGPTVVSWYQFNVTGGTFPATPAQEQAWSNGNDGLWRFMPSIAVDQNGSTAIGYALSSASMFPGIRYAGRLASDPPGNLGQGEAIMFTGTGSQTGNRWGDYSMTSVDTDGTTFWHANEHYTTTSNFNWNTRIGKFTFGIGTPTPTPTATATATPTATATATPTATATATPRVTPTPRPHPTPRGRP